jgi:hypothetical protein
MTRSEFDDIRAHIAAESVHVGDLVQLALELLDDLEHVRAREDTLRAYHARLLAAARAALAAAAAGDPAPLAFLAQEFNQQAHLPAGGGVQQNPADSAAGQDVVSTPVDIPSRYAAPSKHLGYCAGFSRRLSR